MSAAESPSASKSITNQAGTWQNIRRRELVLPHAQFSVNIPVLLKQNYVSLMTKGEITKAFGESESKMKLINQRELMRGWCDSPSLNSARMARRRTANVLKRLQLGCRITQKSRRTSGFR